MQSAAAPSPFPPIADYAFLSNCHTGALIAPDGAIDWLCVPSFDAASVFGSRLTARPGSSGWAVRDQPSDRSPLRAGYQRPRHDLEDAAGWIVVRDALTMGLASTRTRSRRRRGPRPTTTPTHLLVRDGRVPRGLRRDRAGLRAGLRLWQGTGGVDAPRRAAPRRTRAAADSDPPPVDLGSGSREPRPGTTRAPTG